MPFAQTCIGPETGRQRGHKTAAESGVLGARTWEVEGQPLRDTQAMKHRLRSPKTGTESRIQATVSI